MLPPPSSAQPLRCTLAQRSIDLLLSSYPDTGPHVTALLLLHTVASALLLLQILHKFLKREFQVESAVAIKAAFKKGALQKKKPWASRQSLKTTCES